MDSISSFVATAAFAILMLGWFIFATVFFLRKRPPQAKEQKRDGASISGILLQSVSYMVVWSVQRPPLTPFVPWGWPMAVLLALLTVLLVVGSVWLVAAAVRTLGKQWSLTARLIEDHALITDGPYQLVRHPIYTGMLGMLLATGLTISPWWVLVLAVIVFWIGTRIRTRSEEALLGQAFGASYAAYARKVPALVPWFR